MMKIFHIPCLEDNYSYLIIDEATKEAAVVDPVEPEKVLEVAKQHGALLKFVLTTHKHWDHAGGNEKIKELVPGIKVYGGSVDDVKGCTNKVENGDQISLGAGINILSLHTPCHTLGHISYYVTGKEEETPAVFTGDTLFPTKEDDGLIYEFVFLHNLLPDVVGFLKVRQNRCTSHFVLRWVLCQSLLKFIVVMRFPRPNWKSWSDSDSIHAHFGANEIKER